MDAQSREIDGMVFTVRPLPGMAALKLLPRLAKDFGPALAKVANKDMVGAVESLTSAVTGDELASLASLLLETATVQKDGREVLLKPIFDLEMAGRIDTTLKLLWFALEVSAPGFFQTAKTALGRAMPSAASVGGAGETMAQAFGSMFPKR